MSLCAGGGSASVEQWIVGCRLAGRIRFRLVEVLAGREVGELFQMFRPQRFGDARLLIHPFAVLGQQIKLGEGSVVTAGCVLTADIEIGKHVLLNLNTTVGHDVIVGDYSSIMPGAHLSGFVTIGKSVFVGTGASVLQHITIEAGAIIGAGAVVTKPVAKNKTVVGVPARSR